MYLPVGGLDDLLKNSGIRIQLIWLQAKYRNEWLNM
jgi:hypothetical protein